jgi:6-phosphogluconolactonase
LSQRAADVRILADPEELSRSAAREFCARATAAVRTRGHFTVALSGGSTPRRLYRLLAGDGNPRRRPRVPWKATHVFWTDERRVPPASPESNHRAASETLLSRVPIPPAHIHRIRGEEPDAGRAARRYERDLRSFFRLRPGRWPRFDLVLLGVGRDGHIASIFPGSGAPRERRRLAVAVQSRKAPAVRPRVGRITLTLPVINEARCVLVLASGSEKASIVRAVLAGRGGDRPARLVRPRRGVLIWMLDRAAARHL